jgi:hypothetical protein
MMTDFTRTNPDPDDPTRDIASSQADITKDSLLFLLHFSTLALQCDDQNENSAVQLDIL